MAATKVKKKVSGTVCPDCDALLRSGFAGYGDSPDTALRLNPETGKYACAQAHEFSMDELRYALEKANKAAIPGHDSKSEPEMGQDSGFALSSSRAETGMIPGVAGDAAGSLIEDDLLPNGDLPIRLVIPEAMVQPIVELAAQEKKSPSEWCQATFGFWLEDYFSMPAR